MLDFTSQEISDIAEAREKLSKPSKQGSIKTDSSAGDDKKQKGLKDLFKLNKSKNTNESQNSAANLSSEMISPAPIKKTQ